MNKSQQFPAEETLLKAKTRKKEMLFKEPEFHYGSFEAFVQHLDHFLHKKHKKNKKICKQVNGYKDANK